MVRTIEGVDQRAAAGLAELYAPQPASSVAPAIPPGANSPAFADVLQEVRSVGDGLHFSKHARTRLAQRGVTLEADDMRRLQGAVDQAAAKGSRDSLVLMDDLALVVSVRNRTVVTAMDAGSRRNNVFTNIDSVVLAD